MIISNIWKNQKMFQTTNQIHPGSLNSQPIGAFQTAPNQAAMLQNVAIANLNIWF